MRITHWLLFAWLDKTPKCLERSKQRWLFYPLSTFLNYLLSSTFLFVSQIAKPPDPTCMLWSSEEKSKVRLTFWRTIPRVWLHNFKHGNTLQRSPNDYGTPSRESVSRFRRFSRIRRFSQIIWQDNIVNLPDSCFSLYFKTPTGIESLYRLSYGVWELKKTQDLIFHSYKIKTGFCVHF